MNKQAPPSVDDVIDEYGLNVNRSGMTNCPAHEDNTPSLALHREDNWWYCFACLRTGDGVGLIAILDGVEVVDVLGRYAGRTKGWKRRREYGIAPHELRANLVGQYRDLNRDFFNELHIRLAEAPDWIMLMLIERWLESFEEVRDALDDEEISVYEREVAVAQLRARCESWLEAT